MNIMHSKLGIYHQKNFGRFSAAFVQKRRPYGRQILPASHFLLRPLLSYFAEFSAGWQQFFRHSVHICILVMIGEQ
jgi:hypothetical protein